MLFRKMLGKLRGGAETPEHVEGFLSERAFRRILNRERALVDRHSGDFCLILFRIVEGERSNERLVQVARILAERLRTTDVAGWLNAQEVAAILPRTPVQGAQIVAERVYELASDKGLRTCFEVVPYPVNLQREAATSPDKTNPERSDSATPSGQSPLTTSEAAPPSKSIDEILAPPFPAWKRAVDILLASAALTILSPLLLAITALIKVVSPGPVLFKQERVGFLRRKFNCLKFRTMYLNADIRTHQKHFNDLMKGDVPMTKLDVTKDPRVIPFGRILRASGMDELPQLINVLRGEMSLIGPRPCIQYEFDNYETWQKRRGDARPGLTGLWQVSGKNRTTFNQMMRLDISYARKPSFWRDLGIVFRTFPAIIREVTDTFNSGRRSRA